MHTNNQIYGNLPHETAVVTRGDTIEELFTLQMAARFLKVSKKTAYRRLIQWRIPIIRDGRFVRIDKASLVKALHDHEHQY